MKTAIYNTSKICYLITLVLYIGVIPGMVAQFFLGFIHVISALLLYTIYRTLSPSLRKKLNTYSQLVVIYFVGLFFDKFVIHSNGMAGLLYLTLVPMTIGGYFVYVTYKIQSEEGEIKGFKTSENIKAPITNAE